MLLTKQVLFRYIFIKKLPKASKLRYPYIIKSINNTYLKEIIINKINIIFLKYIRGSKISN